MSRVARISIPTLDNPRSNRSTLLLSQENHSPNTSERVRATSLSLIEKISRASVEHARRQGGCDW